MTSPHNSRPLLEHVFEGLHARECLKRRVTVRAQALSGLECETPEAACQRLRSAWKQIYLPSERHLDILVRHLDRARESARQRYPSLDEFERACNDGVAPVWEDPEIWCVTGLAGGGKSSSMEALSRLLNAISDGSADTSCIRPTPRPVLHIRITSTTSVSHVLRSLANPVFVAGRTNIGKPDLIEHIRRWLYSKQVVLILVDELQFLTRSDGASTRVANLIAELAELGVPVTYISNFSLSRKLLGRKQEDKDRLIANPLVLYPLRAEDEHWYQVVAELLLAAPDLFAIDAKRDSPELHRLTAGLYRLLRMLLGHACWIAWETGVRRPVTMVDVRTAYRSVAYSSQREDVEALFSLAVSPRLKRTRSDLLCPFEDISQLELAAARHNFPHGQDRCEPSAAVQHLIESSVSLAGRQVLSDLRKATGEIESGHRKPASVTRLPKKGAVTAESLLAGAKLFRESGGSEAQRTPLLEEGKEKT